MHKAFGCTQFRLGRYWSEAFFAMFTDLAWTLLCFQFFLFLSASCLNYVAG